MKTHQSIRLLAAVVFMGVLSFTASAALIQLQLPYLEYGHVYNTDSGMAGGNPVPWCAPTATANSFQFLEKHYPLILPGQPLTGGNVIGLRNQLATGWIGADNIQHPGMIVSPQGSSDQSWWEHKVWWIEDHVPANTIVFGGMIESDPTSWYRGGDLIQGSPTWNFLWQEVADGEDVEIKIDIGTSVAHVLTLTSMNFDDINNNLVWDPGEARMIDYIDPNNPSQLFQATVSANLVGSRLEFWWNNGGANLPPRWATIEGAYTESVPEPTVLGLLVLGMLTLLHRRSRA